MEIKGIVRRIYSGSYVGPPSLLITDPQQVAALQRLLATLAEPTSYSYKGDEVYEVRHEDSRNKPYYVKFQDGKAIISAMSYVRAQVAVTMP